MLSIYPIISFIAFVLVWLMLVKIGGWSESVFPGPIKVMSSFVELAENGTLLKHSVASLFRVTVGFWSGVLLGVPLGVLMGRIKVIKNLVNPIIQFIRPISPLAWIPLAMLWFGIGDKPAIFLIFLSSFLPMVVASFIAVESINPIYFQVASNFSLNRYEMVSKIIIPAIIPDLVTALRLTISISWMVVVAAEMIAVQSGLGYLVLDSRNALRMDYVMVSMIMIGAIGIMIDMIMYRVSRTESIAATKIR